MRKGEKREREEKEERKKKKERKKEKGENENYSSKSKLIFIYWGCCRVLANGSFLVLANAIGGPLANGGFLI